MAGPAFDYVLPLEDWIQTGVEWVVDHWRPFFQAIRWPIAQTLDAMEGFLLDVPFPVFLIVFVLRSFIVEPFRIPSNSMMPTLLTGDFILVNKFNYGIRLPVLDAKVVDVGRPERGDVVVFRFPGDPTTPFIKRVVGIPGDRIAYYDKVLYVNDEPMVQSSVGRYAGVGSGAVMSGASLLVERIDDGEHEILIQPEARTVQGATVVPEGHYFVLGDNRDNSRDSRYWGTVSDELLIGKAFRIWMNWDFGHGIDWRRVGKSID